MELQIVQLLVQQAAVAAQVALVVLELALPLAEKVETVAQELQLE
jgi:hypothetical protein